MVTGRTQELSTTFNSLQKTALRSRGSIGTLSDLYNRLGRSTKDLSVSNEDLLQVTESIQKAIVISGADASSANAAIVQLGQGLASGQLRGEELNSVLEQTPRVAAALAKELGVGVGGLRALAQEGKITSEVVIDAFRNQRAEIDKEFAAMDATFSQGSTQAGEGMSFVVSEFVKGTGATSVITEGLFSLANRLQALGPVARSTGAALSSLFSFDFSRFINPILIASIKELVESFLNLGSATVRLLSAGVSRVFPLSFLLRVQELASSFQIISRKIAPTLARVFFTLSNTVDNLAFFLDIAANALERSFLNKAVRSSLLSLNSVVLGVGVSLAVLGANTRAFASQLSAGLSDRIRSLAVNLSFVFFQIKNLGKELSGSSVFSYIAQAATAAVLSTTAMVAALAVLTYPIKKAAKSISGLFTTVSNLFQSGISKGVSVLTKGLNALFSISPADLVEGVFSLFQSIGGLSLNRVRLVEQLGEAIGDFSKSISNALAPVINFGKRVLGIFQEMYVKIVGSSYWPDTIRGVIDWSKNLVTKGLRHVKLFGKEVVGVFRSMFNSIKFFVFNGMKNSREFFEELTDGSSGFMRAFARMRNALRTGVAIAVELIPSGLGAVQISAASVFVAFSGAFSKAISFFQKELPLAFDIASGLALSLFVKKFGGGLGFIGVTLGNVLASGVDPEKLITTLDSAVKFLANALGRAAGAFVANLDKLILGIIASIIKAAAEFGRAFLDQLGIIGDVIQVIFRSLGEVIVGGIVGSFVISKFSKFLFGWNTEAKKAGEAASSSLFTALQGKFKKLSKEGGLLGVLAAKLKDLSNFDLAGRFGSGAGVGGFSNKLKALLGITDKSKASFKEAAKQLKLWVKFQIPAIKAVIADTIAKWSNVTATTASTAANTANAFSFTALATSIKGAIASLINFSKAQIAAIASSSGLGKNIKNIVPTLLGLGKNVKNLVPTFARVFTTVAGGLRTALKLVPGFGKAIAIAVGAATFLFSNSSKAASTSIREMEKTTGKAVSLGDIIGITFGKTYETNVKVELEEQTLADSLDLVEQFEERLARVALGLPADGSIAILEWFTDPIDSATLALGNLKFFAIETFTEIGISLTNARGKLRNIFKDVINSREVQAVAGAINSGFQQVGLNAPIDLKPNLTDFVPDTRSAINKLVDDLNAGENIIDLGIDLANPDDIGAEGFLGQEFIQNLNETAVEYQILTKNLQDAIGDDIDNPVNIAELEKSVAIKEQQLKLLNLEGRSLINVGKFLEEINEQRKSSRDLIEGSSKLLGGEVLQIKSQADFLRLNSEEQENYNGLVAKSLGYIEAIKVAFSDSSLSPKEQADIVAKQLKDYDKSLKAIKKIGVEIAKISKFDLAASLNFSIPKFQLLSDADQKAVVTAQQKVEDLRRAIGEAKKLGNDGLIQQEVIQLQLDAAERAAEATGRRLQRSLLTPMEGIIASLSDAGISTSLAEIASVSGEARTSLIENANALASLGKELDEVKLTDPAARQRLTQAIQELGATVQEDLTTALKEMDLTAFDAALAPFKDIGANIDTDAFKELSATISSDILTQAKVLGEEYETINNRFLDGNLKGQKLLTAVAEFNFKVFELQEQARKAQEDALRARDTAEDIASGLSQGIMNVLRGEKSVGELLQEIILNSIVNGFQARMTSFFTGTFETILEKSKGLLGLLGGPSNAEKDALEAKGSKLLKGKEDLSGSGETPKISGVDVEVGEGLEEGAEAATGPWTTMFDRFKGGFGDLLSGNLGGLKDIFGSLGSMLGGLFSGGGGGGGLFGAIGGIAGMFFHDGGIVPDGGGYHKLNGGEMILSEAQQMELFSSAKGGKKSEGTNQQSIAININGDISRQTKKEIVGMLPTIATGVNQFNRENG